MEKYKAAGKIRVIKIRPETHHVATVESQFYTPLFEELFEGAGLSMEDARNKVSIEGHEGPHGSDYNQPILDALTNAVKGLIPHTAAYAAAFLAELERLKAEVARPGSDLNDLVTREH